MHPRLAEVVAHLHETRAALIATATALAPSLLHARPSSDEWSALEILDHVRMIELSITRVVRRAIDAARAAGVGPERSTESVLHSLDRFGVRSSRSKVIAPSFATPRADLALPAVLDELRAAREQFVAALASGDGLDLTAVTAPHPALGVIDLYQWALFVAHHDVRHTKQIGRAVERLAGAASAASPGA